MQIIIIEAELSSNLYDLDSLPYFPSKDGGALSFVSLNGVNHRVRRNPRLGPSDGLRSDGAGLIVPDMVTCWLISNSGEDLLANFTFPISWRRSRWIPGVSWRYHRAGPHCEPAPRSSVWWRQAAAARTRRPRPAG